MSLIEHANRELTLAGLFDEDSDYDGMLGKSALELIEVFAKQGHSGYSAMLTRDLFSKLSNFENLTEITNDPEEWNDVSEISGRPMWQNRRNFGLFSEDGGINYYNIKEDDLKKNFVSKDVR